MDRERSEVSIQLIAPASGAYDQLERSSKAEITQSFHSTDCPSEWGLLESDRFLLPDIYFWSFHSTDCPSEWGLYRSKMIPSGVF